MGFALSKVRPDVDLRYLRKYCRQNNHPFYYYMPTYGEYTCISKGIIKSFCYYSILYNWNLVLCYSGHGVQNTWNWLIQKSIDDELNMDELHSLIKSVFITEYGSNMKAYIVSDCCYSGHWTINISKDKNRYPLFNLIIAPSLKNSKSIEYYFVRAIWGENQKKITSRQLYYFMVVWWNPSIPRVKYLIFSRKIQIIIIILERRQLSP